MVRRRSQTLSGDLEDVDGDGEAVQSIVFADGFDGPLDGLGSGLIARDGRCGTPAFPIVVVGRHDADGKANTEKCDC